MFVKYARRDENAGSVRSTASFHKIQFCVYCYRKFTVLSKSSIIFRIHLSVVLRPLARSRRARVYRTLGVVVASVARNAAIRCMFNSHFLYETNGMHKYFRWCSRPRREDSPMRLPVARRASVPNYRVGSWIRLPRDAARRGTEASVASPVVTPLMNLCICILERGSRHPDAEEEDEDEEEEEEEGSSFLRSVAASFYPLARLGALERCRGFVPTE